MVYRIPFDDWERKISGIETSLRSPEALPPLIVEWRSGILSIRNGNHRAAAMQKAGWTRGWIIVWCNSPRDFGVASAAIGAA